MQKYTPLKEGVIQQNNALDAPPPQHLTNGHATDYVIESDNMANIELAADTAATKHYNNKTNIAKLQWWNAPTPKITLQSSSSFNQAECEALTTPQESNDGGGKGGSENEYSTTIEPVNILLKEQYQQHEREHHHEHHNHHSYRHHHHHDDGGSPLSKSSSSSLYKLHTSDDRLSSKLPLTNQFSIEEDQDQAKLDSQLLLDGIVLDFEVYQGSKTALGERKLGLGASVILRLVRTLPNNSSVFFDRYFTSLPLLERLAEINVHGTGTIQTNRLRKLNLKDDKCLKRGESDQIIRSDEKIVVVKWMDNKSVTLASTAYGQDPVGTVKRWNKEQRSRIEITCPAIVMKYNKNMGGVDICDQMLECYRTWVKSKKWTLKVALHFLDLSVVNVWMEYRLDCRSKNMPRKFIKDLLSFRLEVGEALLFTPKRQFGELDEEHQDEEEQQQPVRLNSKCSPLLGSSKRLDGGGHWSVVDKLKTARACRFQKCNSRTRTRCEKCDVYLCLTSEKNCFKMFHTVI